MGLVLFFLHALFFMILSNLQIACGKNSDDIKTMQLYDNIDRIWKDLAIHGYDSKSDSIDVALINRYDCYNYGGPKAARDAADLLGVTTSSRVLDIGGGIGGPARAIADHTSAEIVSVELQEDLVVLSRQLTAACKLDKKINVLNKNVLDLDASEIGLFDFAVSWLAILHIPMRERHELFTKIYSLLKPGGKVYIEDFFWLGQEPPRPDEMNMLETDLYISDGMLPVKEEYIGLLTSVGFQADFKDVTDEWTQFTGIRLQDFVLDEERHVRVYNRKTYESLLHFYSTVADFFANRGLGGVKLVLTKPMDAMEERESHESQAPKEL